MHRVQHAQGQPASARSAHEFDLQTKTAKMAAVRPDYVLCSTARSLEALCRSRILERGTERLASLSESAIFLQKATPNAFASWQRKQRSMFAHEIHEKRETLRIKTSADFAFYGPFVSFRVFSG